MLGLRRCSVTAKEASVAMNDLELAVCSEMVFTELPIIDRVRRIDDMGFAVEIWSWHDKDLQALAETGARFSSMTGYLHGDLVDPAHRRRSCADGGALDQSR